MGFKGVQNRQVSPLSFCRLAIVLAPVYPPARISSGLHANSPETVIFIRIRNAIVTVFFVNQSSTGQGERWVLSEWVSWNAG